MTTAKFEELVRGFTATVVLAVRTALDSEGVLKQVDLDSVREEIQQDVLEMIEVPRVDIAAFSEQLEVLGARVDSVANHANVKKEGLRKKTELLYRRMARLEFRIKNIESALEEGPEGPEHEQSWDESEVEGEDYYDYEALLFFRRNLKVGMPVHLDGLASRPDLNGKAGFLKEWSADRQRWAVAVGRERLLISADKLVP